MSEVANGTVISTRLRARILAISIMGYAFDGMDIIVFALAAPLLLNAWPTLNVVQIGVIATCMLIGMSCGGYIFGPIADKFGRKRALVWCIAFFGITTGLTGFAQDYIQMAALRFLAGLGLGAEWALGGTLLQEFTEPEKRAKYSSYMQMGWPLGYGVTILVGYFLTPIFGWQILYYLGATAVFLAIYIHLGVPESPMWLNLRDERAKGLVDEKSKAGVAQVGFKDLLKKEHLRTFVYVVIICTSMMCTYWAVNTWLPTILAKERGMSPKGYSTLLMALQIVALAAYFFSAWISGKFTKRAIMAVSGLLSALTLYVWLGIEWENDMTFNVLAGLAWIPPGIIWAVLNAYLVEQFPTNIRVAGVASGFATGRLIATLLPIAMGAAAQQYGLTVVMTACAVFYVIVTIAVLMLRPKTQHI